LYDHCRQKPKHFRGEQILVANRWKENCVTERARWIGLVVFIAICLGAGGLGAIATTPEIEGWYKTIEKPSWNPPDYIFGPV